MKFLSVCSGIEAASVAWHPLGWESVAYSEIEPFPCKVLEHHYPDVPNLGDMTKFKEWPDADVNVFVGGTPCQSFSVAGLRKGLDDPRGNLMLTYLAIAKRYRPNWLVWENVPGVLSSADGRDFGSFLGGLAILGYGFAYRVLDAQYFGVAQRRKRVFVVGYLGDWRPAAAVLFERHSLSGHPAPSREKGKAVAVSTSTSPVYGGSDPNTSDTVTSKWAKGSGGPAGNECGLFVAQPIAFSGQMSNPQTDVDMTQTLGAKNPMAVAQAMAVRRLTPVECERLQGFPDKYTDIQPKNKATPDGPRYKALGNSMAVPVMAWIGKRIQEVDAICKTQQNT
jgi:DNA (cytosine-5)-methyltransferase 1